MHAIRKEPVNPLLPTSTYHAAVVLVLADYFRCAAEGHFDEPLGRFNHPLISPSDSKKLDEICERLHRRIYGGLNAWNAPSLINTRGDLHLRLKDALESVHKEHMATLVEQEKEFQRRFRQSKEQRGEQE